MTRLEDLSEEEIRRRAPVWTALADLFLDTEPRESDLRFISRTIREAGYTLLEAEDMLQFEVGPVFVWNLSVLGGVPSSGGRWYGWSEEEVCEKVISRLRQPRLWERIPIWRDVGYGYQWSACAPYWRQVRAYHAEGKAGDDAFFERKLAESRGEDPHHISPQTDK